MDKIKNKAAQLYIVFSFVVVDAWLRMMTRWLGYYSIFALAPNCFTLCWAIVFATITVSISRRSIRKAVYCILYFGWVIYAVIQYGAYLILNKILFLSDFALAEEGIHYVDYILKFIDVKLIVSIIFLLIVGILGVFSYKYIQLEKNKYTYVVYLLSVAFFMNLIPNLYGEISEKGNWANPANEYLNFVNAGFDLELSGTYQYVFRDLYLNVQRNFKDNSEMWNTLDKIVFSQHTDNRMTGVFKGKNLIVVMMESMDDWMINDEDTPTIQYMIDNGINFEKMYTPQYSNGYTFNTEFAFNTSIYPFSNGNAAYTLSNNTFIYSLPNLFKGKGYSVNSFHEGDGHFYNRDEMHKTFGYEKYNSYNQYAKEEIPVQNDTFLISSDKLWADVTGKENFMSFVITYSPHLPYEKDDLVEYVARKNPKYDKEGLSQVECARAKAMITDEMFAGMLQRLDNDGLLDNTVIVAFTDHYTYGIDDKELLKKLSISAGDTIFEKTPAFIYCNDFDNRLSVDKVCQITDLGPTLANMFDLDVPSKIMGNDIFNDDYKGYAIFPNNTWLTNQTYIKEGKVEWNDGMAQSEIDRMNNMVSEIYWVNDAILQSDYYKYVSEILKK